MSTTMFEVADRYHCTTSGKQFSWSTLGLRSLSPFHRLHLLYVGFWFIVPSETHSARQWWFLLLAFVVFLPFFTALHEGKRRTIRLVGLVGLMLLAFVYVPYNLSAFGIYIYVATALDRFASTARSFYLLLFVMCAAIVLQALVLHLPLWEMLSAMGASVLAAGTIHMQHRLLAQRRKSDAKLRMAHDEIEQLAKAAERERIARDLHDVLGHTLSLISVKSDLAARLLSTDIDRAAQELSEIQSTARRALAEVRQTVSGYRAQGIEAEMQEANAALTAAGVVLAGRPDRLPRLPAQQEAALSLILREAVTNIVRHAGARSCTIGLDVDDASAVLTICDDGHGMLNEEGNGMQGMRERCREQGGTLSVESGPTGTTLRVQLPASIAERQTEILLGPIPVIGAGVYTLS